MAEKKPYTSIIDAFLADREPDWKDLGIADAKKSGEEQLDRSHQYVDTDFEDELSEGISRHTPVWGPKSGKKQTASEEYQERMAAKDMAAPRIAAAKDAWHKEAYPRQEDYKSDVGGNQSLLDELTMSADKAYSGSNLAENSAAKKEITDAQVQKYIRDLLNTGTSPAKVAAKLEKLAEIELFNHQSATDYLQRNAGLMGLAYLEPNTYMDKTSPKYERTASGKTADLVALDAECNALFRRLDALKAEGKDKIKGGEYDQVLRQLQAKTQERNDSIGLGVRSLKGSKKADYPKNPELQALEDAQAQVCPRDARNRCDRPDAESCCGGGYNAPCDCRVCHPAPDFPSAEYHDASGNACVQQKRAWDRTGVKPQARSVKQVKACPGCAYFNKDARGKTCNLYHLPVVANEGELAQIVNHLTPGVPEKRKHAALVTIANDGMRVQPVKFGEQTNLIKTADARVKNQQKRASSLFSDERETKMRFSSEHVGKMHDRGASLEQVYKWATGKFGDVDTSLAFRGFVQNLKKDAKGKIVVASADLRFLNGIGIRNAAYQGAEKCASCPTHFNRQAREVEEDRGAQRVEGKFAAHTIDVARGLQKEAAVVTIQRDAVRKLHSAGHSLERIFEGAARKVGSVQARRLMADFVIDVKKRPGKTAVSEADRAFLIGKLGFRPEAVRLLDPNRRPTNRVVASVPDGTRIVSYPGMGKQAGEKVAKDGHAILNEYDLSGPVEGPTIDTDGPQRGEVEMNPTFRVDLD
jgi:hypothetical protein